MLPTVFDPSALHDREALSQMDAVEATAWFGSRLAEALDFAHKNGVLHRDIKPANILVNSYGRPMLADFNISSRPVGHEHGGEEVFGGTFAYMSPEHLDAFNPAHPARPDSVDERSDLYSLGLVLEQLLGGQISFPLPPLGESLAERLHMMAAERRQIRMSCRTAVPGGRQALERTISRALEPQPQDRFASGDELAKQLDGCRRLREAERRMTAPRPILQRILRAPIAWLILLVVMPQLVASGVNIAYNVSQIGGRLATDQQQLFNRLILGYNALVYPVAVGLFITAVRPVTRCWTALCRREKISDDGVVAARRRSLQLPRWIAALTMLGWFPGGVLFPFIIHLLAGPLDIGVMAHFLASFWLSGLIALAYSLCGVQLVAVRALYPAMWIDLRDFSHIVRKELAPLDAQLTIIQWLAGSIPLVAAILTLFLARDADVTFRFLVAGLIVLGMIGYHFAMAITRGLSQVLVALTEAKS
jgi:hypothetical protein